MSLHGLLAAERDDLPEVVRRHIDRIAEVHLIWLSEVLMLDDPTIDPLAVNRRVRAIFAAVSGAQLAARGRGDVPFFDGIIQGYRDLGLLQV